MRGSCASRNLSRASSRVGSLCAGATKVPPLPLNPNLAFQREARLLGTARDAAFIARYADSGVAPAVHCLGKLDQHLPQDREQRVDFLNMRQDWSARHSNSPTQAGSDLSPGNVSSNGFADNTPTPRWRNGWQTSKPLESEPATAQAEARVQEGLPLWQEEAAKQARNDVLQAAARIQMLEKHINDMGVEGATNLLSAARLSTMLKEQLAFFMDARKSRDVASLFEAFVQGHDEALHRYEERFAQSQALVCHWREQHTIMTAEKDHLTASLQTELRRQLLVSDMERDQLRSSNARLRGTEAEREEALAKQRRSEEELAKVKCEQETAVARNFELSLQVKELEAEVARIRDVDVSAQLRDVRLATEERSQREVECKREHTTILEMVKATAGLEAASLRRQGEALEAELSRLRGAEDEREQTLLRQRAVLEDERRRNRALSEELESLKAEQHAQELRRQVGDREMSVVQATAHRLEVELQAALADQSDHHRIVLLEADLDRQQMENARLLQALQEGQHSVQVMRRQVDSISAESEMAIAQSKLQSGGEKGALRQELAALESENDALKAELAVHGKAAAPRKTRGKSLTLDTSVLSELHTRSGVLEVERESMRAKSAEAEAWRKRDLSHPLTRSVDIASLRTGRPARSLPTYKFVDLTTMDDRERPLKNETQASPRPTIVADSEEDDDLPGFVDPTAQQGVRTVRFPKSALRAHKV